jgi:hypothetical protein
MKAMRTYIFLVTLVCGFALQSCYEDKGSYDYLQSNTVTITINLPSENAYLGVPYIYTPEVTFKNPENINDFKYWWEVGGFNTSQEIICEGKELNFTANVLGTQYLQFCVEEISTKVVTRRLITLNGVAEYSKGWLVLSEDGGKSILSYIRPGWKIGETGERERIYTVFPNLYGSIYADDLGSGPISIRPVYSRVGRSDDLSLVYIIQKNGSICLDGFTYKKEVLLEREFIGGLPEGFDPLDYFQNNYACVILNADSKLYYREPYNGTGTTFFTYQFPNFPMEQRGEVLKVDKLIPGVQIVSNFMGWYDKINRKIQWWNVTSYSTGGPVNPQIMEGITEFVDFNNLGDIDVLFCNVQNAGDIKLLYRKNGGLFMQQCRGTIAAPNLNLTGLTNMTIREEDKPYFTSNTLYYLLRERPYLFLAEDNKIYYYDLNANKVTPFYSFSSVEKIVDFSSNPREGELGVVLSNGKFVTLDIVDEHLNNTHLIGEATIPGRIVDLEYKFTGFWDITNGTLD